MRSKRTRFSIYALCALAACFATVSVIALASDTRFDAAADFSPSSNPAGAWSYGWSTARGTAFNLYGSRFQVSGLDEWAAVANGLPGLSHNGTAGTINPAGTDPIPAGALCLHPGPGGENSILRWTAPSSGLYRVAATFEGLDTQGTTTDVAVLHGATQLFSGDVTGYLNTQSFTGDVSVIAGETIDFTVGFGSNGNYYYDSTGLSVTIVADQCTPPPPGLVSWWPGDGDATDIIGGHDGTLQNGAAFAAGEVGQAFSFDGVDDKVVVASTTALEPTEITLDAWIFVDATADPAGIYGIVGKYLSITDPPPLYRGYELFINNGKLTVRAGTINQTFAESANDVVFGQWNHVAATINSSASNVYLNGNLEGSGPGVPSIEATSQPFVIGAREGGTNFFFKGQIDEVEVFSRALTQTEVQAIYNAGSFGKCKATPTPTPTPTCTTPPPDMVSWWPGDNNPSDIVGGNNGTLQNGATFAAGEVGQAFIFNGAANQYVLVGDPVPASLQIQNEITLDAWIYVTAYPASDTLGLIVGSQYDAAQAGATIFLDGRTSPDGQPSPPGHIHFQIGDGSWHTTNVNAQVRLNQWVHIAATRKANEDAKVYYNGVLQPSTSVPWSGSISYSGAWFAIGQQKDIYRPFNGLIDEVEVYNRALTATEIANIYNAGSAGKCKRFRPTITWDNPADITYGTALSATQLNATADVPGTFTYTPGSSTVLNAGNSQTLSVDFTPNDTTNYTSASKQVTINVNKRDATWTTNPNTKTYGDADPVPLTTGSASNFVSGDGVSATYSRVAGETVSGSPYHITAALSANPAGALDNYNITNNGADFNILKASTSTVVNSSQNPSAYGQQITLTATVSPVAPGAGTPSGAVQFFDNGASLGTQPLSGGVATLTISTLPTGNHSITANYAGDTNFIGSTSAAFIQTVTKPPTSTSLISSANPSRFGQAVTFTATVVDGLATPTGSVEFLDGAVSLGSANLRNGVAVFTTSTLTVGGHSITARYAATRNYLGSISPALAQQVNKADTSAVLVSSAKNNTSQFGKSVTFTATVSAVSPGSGTPSGTVQFYDGTAALGAPQTLTRGQATISTSSLSRGSHSIKAVYSGDGSFNGNTSPVLVQQVN